jgi:hypothetical protein
VAAAVVVVGIVAVAAAVVAVAAARVANTAAAAVVAVAIATKSRTPAFQRDPPPADPVSFLPRRRPALGELTFPPTGQRMVTAWKNT